jgi:hypothetical protein
MKLHPVNFKLHLDEMKLDPAEITLHFGNIKLDIYKIESRILLFVRCLSLL